MVSNQQEIIKEITDKDNKPQKRYVIAITRGKKNHYLNVSIPNEISAKLQLTFIICFYNFISGFLVC